MKSSITTPQVTELLETLSSDASMNDPLVEKEAREAGVTGEGEADFFRRCVKLTCGGPSSCPAATILPFSGAYIAFSQVAHAVNCSALRRT
jgi:hypothetical protein